MMFWSRLSRSLSHTSRSLISGNYNAVTKPIVTTRRNAYVSLAVRGVRNYITCREATKKVACEPRLVRLFSSEAVKNYGKNCTDEIPNEKLLVLLIILGVLQPIFFGKKMVMHLPFTFEEFKNEILRRPFLVDHIVVSDEGIAYAYIKHRCVKNLLVNSDHIPVMAKLFVDLWSNNIKMAFFFKIENVDTFEEELMEAQHALAIDPLNYVQVRHENRWKIRFSTKFV